MEGFCRGCLIKYNEPTELLQYTEKNRRLFVYCTGIQVKRNDTFTFQLCKDCYLNMKLACKFKKLCRTSDKTFKNYILLKEDNNTIDFCTFLKNNDDALTIRFPLIPNSTPANQMGRDDDNESTCTSIRNFMTDMLQGEEMPDTESRIIREVIEEEADVLDDSLDSYWLQDDISIDTDFRLDFSFSPFSTPRSFRNNNCYTPNKEADLKQVDAEINYYTSKGDKKEPVPDENNLINGDKNIMKSNNPDDIELDYLQLNNDMLEIEENFNNRNILQGKHPQNFYVSNDNFKEPVQIEVKDGNGKVVLDKSVAKCTIDRNLEEALKNESNKEFCLDDLLVSPQVYPGDSPASSPSITSILFGRKLDGGTRNVISKKEVGQLIEKFQGVIGGIEVENFLNRNELQMYSDDEEKDAIEKSDPFSIENKFDIDNSFCILCNKKFINCKALRIHAVKTHKIKINNPNKKAYKYKLRICDICGKGFRDSPSFYRHKNRHKEENTILKCERCAMIFSSTSKLKLHMISHTGKTVPKDTGKKYVCNICGAISNHYANFRIHKMRHSKTYTKTCEECGKGFFRSSDLITHMRSHTGERPFKCEHCSRSFSRRDGLLRHVKAHTDERRFQCDHCNNKFITKMNLKHHIQYSKACIKLRDSLEVGGTSKDSAKMNVFYAVGSQDKINKKIKSLQPLHLENENNE